MTTAVEPGTVSAALSGQDIAPAAETFSSTCPGPGSGSGTVTSSGGPDGPVLRGLHRDTSVAVTYRKELTLFTWFDCV